MKNKDVTRQCKEILLSRLKAELGLIFIVTALFALTAGLGSLASLTTALILGVVWAVVSVILLKNYMKKKGNRFEGTVIGVMTMAVTEHRAYRDPEQTGRKLFYNRFSRVTEYEGVLKAVKKSVREIQIYFEKMTEPEEESKGAQALVDLGKFLQHLYLRYVAYACLGYTYWCHDMELWAAAGDSVAVYAYNWKRLTKESADTVILSCAFLAVGTALLSALNLWLFSLMHIGAFGFYGVLLSFLIVVALKRAFFDPAVEAKLLMRYVDDAQRTELNDKLYLQLSRVSGEYKRLLIRADAEANQPAKRKRKRK